MAKYHIDINGKPAVCRASERACPLGGDEVHFSSQAEAQAFVDKMHAIQFGILAAKGKKFDLLRNEKDHVVLEIPWDRMSELDVKGDPIWSGNEEYIKVTKGEDHIMTIRDKDGNEESFNFGLSGRTLVSEKTERKKKAIMDFLKDEMVIMESDKFSGADEITGVSISYFGDVAEASTRGMNVRIAETKRAGKVSAFFHNFKDWNEATDFLRERGFEETGQRVAPSGANSHIWSKV